MKKRFTALLLAALMVMGTVAVAAGVEKSITVTPMALNVNGQVVTPTKSDGTPAEVFAYEGATYAPLRYLTELNGNQVVWDNTDPSTAKITTGMTYADTIVWDGEYDVVVVGFGGAGAVSARYAADAGANVLLVEKAPEGHEGGNTRVCGQYVGNGDDFDRLMTYYHGLFGEYEIDEKVLETYVRGITQTKNVIVNEYGHPEDSIFSKKNAQSTAATSPDVAEYPELEGSDAIDIFTITEQGNDGALWRLLRQAVIDRAENIDVWFESPGKHLIQDPVSKAIIGVQIEKQGTLVNIRAKNGVILTTGGFENNPQMVQDYLGLTNYVVAGSTYNTGDGIKMATEVGADLWHMETYEGAAYLLGGVSYPVDGIQGAGCYNVALFGTGSAIAVGDEGVRYLKEDTRCRHGHVNYNGDWVMPRRPDHTYLIFDQVKYDEIAAANGIPEEYQGKIVKANTLAELAEVMEMPKLEQSVSDFNHFAEIGNDMQYGRAPESMRAFSKKGPYYAFEFIADLLNTQGGPRRNANAEILDIEGNPIPHLYSAGELGGVIAHQYQGAGNMAECLTFGKIAGKNAAAAKNDQLPKLTTAKSNLVYTPGKETDIGKDKGSDVALSAGEYLGVSHKAMGGDLQVKVTVENGKITKVEVLDNKETEGIGTKAIDALPDAIVKAGSTQVDNVSGATVTSNAIKEAVDDALSQVK